MLNQLPAGLADPVAQRLAVREAANAVEDMLTESDRREECRAAYRRLTDEGVPAGTARAAVAEAARRGREGRGQVRRAGLGLLPLGVGLTTLGLVCLLAAELGTAVSCLSLGLACLGHGVYQFVTGRGRGQ